MKFTKPIMSITELTEIGFSRTELKQFVHVKRQRFAYKTPGDGKWKIDTQKFDDYLSQKSSRDSTRFG